MNESNEKWIGIEEAAEYMNVTKDTVRNWIKKTDMQFRLCEEGCSYE